MTTYALKTSDESAKALDLQQSIVGQATFEAVEKAGLKQGMQVWEYGCGNGTVTAYLAQTVGSQGHVVAIDQSHEQIERMLESIENRQSFNITAKIEDLNTFIPSEQVADFVFGRYILMHLKNPEHVLMAIKSNLLKAKGIVCFAEPSWKDTVIEGPFAEELNAFGCSVIKLGQTLGTDYNFGSKLKSCVINLGFDNVRETKMTFSYESQLFSELLSIRLTELGDKLLKSQCATHAEIEKWVDIAKAMPFHPEKTCAHMPLYFVSGNI